MIGRALMIRRCLCTARSKEFGAYVIFLGCLDSWIVSWLCAETDMISIMCKNSSRLR